jgi:tetratricopeptide (TPR) repeat protein
MNEPDDPNQTADVPSVPADSLDAGLTSGSGKPADPLDTTHYVSGLASTADPRPAASPGADGPAGDLPAVPGYQVLREIARGGMGRVLAACDLGLDRDVALKVLLPGANADRFVRESKITARLPHPGIPPVHALGTLADGSPFLAMKLVAGQTLAVEMKTADRPRLLQAFTQVCQAVGFAHSRGVIHRDLKPANVMVGAFGEVQVMDWGLAKDLAGREGVDEPRSAEVPMVLPVGTDSSQTADYRTLGKAADGQTQAGQVMGTPAYMAPEQARGEAVDARSDVFALGGILCAILTGQPPFRGKSAREVLRRAAAADLADANARLDGCGADADLIAVCRRCLSPSPADRPADGRAVADGLTAYLNGAQDRLRAAEIARAAEAARAEEATRTAAEANERARVERRARRVQFIAASLLLLVLVGGIVGTTFGLVQAQRARGRAETAEGEAKTRAEELQQVANFQGQMLRQVDPASAGLRLSGDVKAKFEAALTKAGVPEGKRAEQAEAFASQWGRVNATDAALALIDSTILQPAVAAIDKQFKDQPAVDAALRATLAERYMDLGLYDAAKPLLERALETRRRVLGEEHPDTLSSIGDMGSLLQSQGKPGAALAYYREALEKSRRVLGEDHRATLDALSNMGAVLIDLGKIDEAAPYYHEVLDRCRRIHGEDDPVTLSAMGEVGTLLQKQGKPAEATTYFREVLEKRRRVLGTDHPDTITSLASLGNVLTEQGKGPEAAECFREVLEKRRHLLGDVHPSTLRTMSNLGDTFSRLGKYVEAEALLREALTNKRKLLGADHPSTLITLSNLAVFLIQRGRGAEAEPMCLESLEKQRRMSGPNHPGTLVATNVMGYLYLNLEKPAKAEPYLREALAISRRINGEAHPDTLTYTINVGTSLLEQDRLSEAETNLRTAVEKAGAALGKEHPITLNADVRLGDLLNKQKRYAEAAQLLATIEPAVRKTSSTAGQRLPAILLQGLGKARLGLKQFEAAEANLLEAHPIWVKARGEAHPDTRRCVQVIVDLYTAWHAAQPGKGYNAKAKEWKAKLGAA